MEANQGSCPSGCLDYRLVFPTFAGSASKGKNSKVYNCSLATLSMQVMLTIRGSTTDTGVVSLRLPVDDVTLGNRNPVIAGISLSSSGVLLDPFGTAAVPRKSDVKLLAQVDEAQAEAYLDRELGPDNEYVRDGNGQYVLGPTQERLTLSWFAEGGGFGERTTSWGPHDVDVSGHSQPFGACLENSWATPTVEDYAAASSLVIVVVRDSRGGVTWTRGVASLEGTLLKCERAVRYALGIELKPSSAFSADVTGFYKSLDHLVSETSATRTEGGREIPLRYDNNGVGRVVGMELVLRREPIHRFSGWIAYTLSRSERRDSGSTDYRLFQYDQTHILTAVAMLRFGHNWELSSRFRLMSGNPNTPVTGAVLDLDSGVYKPTMLDAYLDVQNVTNRANVEAPDYNFDYRKTKTVAGMPLYPILGLRAEL
jgi:hypothetical protein